jgi:hypothetical protein
MESGSQSISSILGARPTFNKSSRAEPFAAVQSAQGRPVDILRAGPPFCNCRTGRREQATVEMIFEARVRDRGTEDDDIGVEARQRPDKNDPRPRFPQQPPEDLRGKKLGRANACSKLIPGTWNRRSARFAIGEGVRRRQHKR